MKFVFLAIALAAVLPLADWLRRNPREMPKVWTAVGAFPFILTIFPNAAFMAIISWALWTGYVRGAEFALLDVLTLALFLALPRSGHPLPFRLAMGCYFAAMLFASVHSSVPMAGAFYLWQLGRAFLLYAIIVRASADERVVPALLNGLAIGICIQACYVVYQRFGLGVVQAGGTMGHQNSLGILVPFVACPLLALKLAGQRGLLSTVAILACGLIAIFGASRATFGLFLGACILVFLLSAKREWNARKAKVAMTALMGAILLSPLAISTFERRFGETSMFDTVDERPGFENAAKMILKDYPLGVGPNNYVTIANIGGYLDRAGVSHTPASRQTSVHNAYWLMAAEAGYLGLLTFIVLLLRPLVTAFVCGWNNPKDPRGDLLLGLSVALLVVYVHNLFEWIFFTFVTQYVFAIAVGIIASTAGQLGYWWPARAQSLAVSAAGATGHRWKQPL